MLISKTFRIGIATVTYTDDGCYTKYDDGSHYAAQPHDTDHYNEIAVRCGYLPSRAWPGFDTIGPLPAARLAYCREHEAAHHFVSEFIYGSQSHVLWEMAHGREPEHGVAIFEEMAAQQFQRFIRAGERPIVGGVNWDKLRERALSILDQDRLKE